MILDMHKYLYVIFIAMGLMSNFVFACITSKQYGIKTKNMTLCCVIETIGMYIGAKVINIILNTSAYIKDILFIKTIHILFLKVATNGFAFSGAVIGGSLFIYLFAYRCKHSSVDLFNILLPNMLLVYSLSKIGCFYNNCCIGINGFPIQLLESFISLLLFIIICIIRLKHIHTYKVIYMTCFSYSSMRFILDLLRASDNIYFLSFSQILSVFIFILGIMILKLDKAPNHIYNENH